MTAKSPITTHILDTSRGRPATGVTVRLARVSDDGEVEPIGRGATDADGRVTDLMRPGALTAGTYRIAFDTSGYFAGLGTESFYPTVQIDFVVHATDEHYHVPLLLNPFGFSTYRGS